MSCNGGTAPRRRHITLELATIKWFLRFHVAMGRRRSNEEHLFAESMNNIAEWLFFVRFAQVIEKNADQEERDVLYH